VIAQNVIENRDAPHTFLQKKKGKKRKPSCLVEGFKKASFTDKILPISGCGNAKRMLWY
jgi:hypothetical protein